MQMRKGKSPRSACHPTINPQDTFPAGSLGSSCCALRNSRAQGFQTELFPSHSEQGPPPSSKSLRRRGKKKKQPSHHHQHKECLSINNRRISDRLMCLRLGYFLCKMGIIPSISVEMFTSDSD